MSSITEKVAEQIAGCNEVVKERVIQHLVEKEIARRTEAVISRLSLIETLSREIEKIKPDIIAYGDDGKIASQAWSKAKLDERNASKAKLEKLHSALSKSLDAGDYSALLTIV